MKIRRTDVESFRIDFCDAFAYKDVYVSQKDVETFIQLNWYDDKYEELSFWSLSDFLNFASDICAAWGNFWEAAHQWGFIRQIIQKKEDK